ncbi:hypothetical protein FA95DRAFT_1657092 [Auriscalpium vulgare]|uniref:Uncharacterized protein n=1 Tax=Auriscalpium vulgare TaxID=40419 RepID=A0ACB8R5P2_9AGAM|nr:hypothetical protein FA95DRAFT_1657092 [Auriscalpium vulgare]
MNIGVSSTFNTTRRAFVNAECPAVLRRQASPLGAESKDYESPDHKSRVAPVQRLVPDGLPSPLQLNRHGDGAGSVRWIRIRGMRGRTQCRQEWHRGHARWVQILNSCDARRELAFARDHRSRRLVFLPNLAYAVFLYAKVPPPAPRVLGTTPPLRALHASLTALTHLRISTARAVESADVGIALHARPEFWQDSIDGARGYLT